MDITPEIRERPEKLHENYSAMGQDMVSYLDTLLSLQNPKTPLPDEEIFIIYHQITELFFKLVFRSGYFILNSGSAHNWTNVIKN